MTGQSKLKGEVLQLMLVTPWAWSGFFVVVVVVYTPTDYIEGLFLIVSQFNVTVRILNVLHAKQRDLSGFITTAPYFNA